MEVIPPIAYSTFPVGTGDITAVNTPAGSGLTGGAASGDVNLSLQVCAAGQVLKSLGSTWACAADNDTDTNSGGTVTSVTAGAGLTATPNPITTAGTVAIATSYQLPQGCSNGQVAEWSGSAWVCANDDNSGGTVTAVTATAPLASTGGTTPIITLPHVKIQATNTSIGTSALSSNTTGFSNTASGVSALAFNTTGSQNTASGRNALQSNTTGSANTASGASALQSNATGANNTASGVSALAFNTTGGANTASGRSALQNNTTGSENTASGAGALVLNTAGSANTASGVNALFRNTTGSLNTASGKDALAFNTTGGLNTASGLQALRNNSTGGLNTASGSFALASNTSGSNNTAIGFEANVSVGNLTNATAIGANAIVDASDKIRLGNGSVTAIEGQVAFSFPSDKTKKENFQPVDGEEVLKKIGGLGLTSWNFIGHDPKQFRHYGPMAQDFFAAFGNDGIGTIGTPTTINSGDMAGILMIAVQALEKQNVELKVRVSALEQLVKERPYLTASVPVQ